jgi:hypothetical protein
MTLSLDSSWIADVSMDAYSIGLGGTISLTRYARYLTIISDRLTKDGLLDSVGNIKSGSEYLAAMLVCDLIQSGPQKEYGITGESYGNDYRYTRSTESANSTKSTYLTKYELALSGRNRGVYSSSGVIRADAEIEFAKLSQGDIPKAYLTED